MGKIAPSRIRKWIVAANMAPVADAGGPYFLTAGDKLYLDAQMSYDPDGGPSWLTYQWDLDNDGEFDDATGRIPRIGWKKLEELFGYQSGKHVRNRRVGVRWGKIAPSRIRK